MAHVTPRSNRSLIKFVRWYKENHPCVDCGDKFPYYVMQFDHIGDDKHSNINKMMWRSSLAKVIEEIQKCELVCANHHARRTFERQLAVAMTEPIDEPVSDML